MPMLVKICYLRKFEETTLANLLPLPRRACWFHLGVRVVPEPSVVFLLERVSDGTKLQIINSKQNKSLRKKILTNKQNKIIVNVLHQRIIKPFALYCLYWKHLNDRCCHTTCHTKRMNSALPEISVCSPISHINKDLHFFCGFRSTNINLIN